MLREQVIKRSKKRSTVWAQYKEDGTIMASGRPTVSLKKEKESGQDKLESLRMQVQHSTKKVHRKAEGRDLQKEEVRPPPKGREFGRGSGKENNLERGANKQERGMETEEEISKKALREHIRAFGKELGWKKWGALIQGSVICMEGQPKLVEGAATEQLKTDVRPEESMSKQRCIIVIDIDHFGTMQLDTRFANRSKREVDMYAGWHSREEGYKEDNRRKPCKYSVALREVDTIMPRGDNKMRQAHFKAAALSTRQLEKCDRDVSIGTEDCSIATGISRVKVILTVRKMV